MVIVHQAEKIDGQRVQKVRIVWNCFGESDGVQTITTEKGSK